MTLRVELLPAGYGDAILVGYGKGKKPTHHLLIDAGQAGTTGPLLARLKQLRRDGGRIDLFVITHVDADHVGGALKILNDEAAAAMIQGVWFNGYVHLQRGAGLLGPIQGEALTQRIVELKLPWNVGWPRPIQDAVGGPVVAKKPATRALPGDAEALVLSPTPESLKRLLGAWKQVVTAAGLRPGKPATEEPPLVAPGLLGATLKELAKDPTPADDAPANGSSIAFVFEFEGKRVLFGADAHPDVLVASLAALREKPYRLAACKLPHHGSKANVTAPLVSALDCRRWLVSTNGVRFQHPDDAALARVVVVGTRNGGEPIIGWNYRSARFKAFTRRFPPANSGYELCLPGKSGLVVEL
jgi:glyoxylase-like metal-dependent hydrolase (beta-lactamase superfamily II)